MTPKVRGTVCGVCAAVSYGLNPLGALPLYADGVNVNSVLFYRYGLAAVILAAVMLSRRMSFSVTAMEMRVLVPLGVLFSLSSLTLFDSFTFMDAGVASTLLFVYPVMVAVMMAVFFKEKLTPVTVFSIALALTGISLLYGGGTDGGVLSTTGVLLVMVSSLTYAIYIIIVVNKSSLRMSSVKLTFYVLLVSLMVIIANSVIGGDSCRLQMLTTPRVWFFASLLAVFPTVVSLLLMVVAVHEIGSTPTAVMGALEPLTAVAIGVVLFGEAFTVRLAVGMLMILSAVILIVLGKSLSVSYVTLVIGRFGHKLAKHWRWK